MKLRYDSLSPSLRMISNDKKIYLWQLPSIIQMSYLNYVEMGEKSELMKLPRDTTYIPKQF